MNSLEKTVSENANFIKSVSIALTLLVVAFAAAELSGENDVGPCIHTVETRAEIGPVNDASTGQQIQDFRIKDLRAVTAGSEAQVTGLNRSCEGICRFNLSRPGNYTLTIESEGYTEKTVSNSTFRQSFQPGCPSRELQLLKITAELEPEVR